MKIMILRHAESTSNTHEQDPLEVGDHNIALTENGIVQAVEAGKFIGAAVLRQAIVYKSPYKRTRQTWEYLRKGAEIEDSDTLGLYEDPRLRELDHGYENVEEKEALRQIHGWFYYRFPGGESPAEVFDRMCTFLESMKRQVRRKNPEHVLIVSHGVTIRCLVMRFMHLKVEDYDRLSNPKNCSMITIAPAKELENSQFTSGKWGVVGLRFRQDRQQSVFAA